MEISDTMKNMMTRKQYHINKLLNQKWAYRIEMSQTRFTLGRSIRDSLGMTEMALIEVPELHITTIETTIKTTIAAHILLSDGCFELHELSNKRKDKIISLLNNNKPIFLDKIKRELPDDIKTTLCDCLLQNRGLEYRELI